MWCTPGKCVWLLCSSVRAYQYSLGLLMLEGKVICKASQNKLILCNETFLLWLEWLLPGWQSPPSTGHGRSLNGWKSMKMIWVTCTCPHSNHGMKFHKSLDRKHNTHLVLFPAACFYREHINYAKSNSIQLICLTICFLQGSCNSSFFK